MSKIMDRLFDLTAVDWKLVPVGTLDEWVEEAVSHDSACRCEKCAVYYARLEPKVVDQYTTCPIQRKVIRRLRGILLKLNKL